MVAPNERRMKMAPRESMTPEVVDEIKELWGMTRDILNDRSPSVAELWEEIHQSMYKTMKKKDEWFNKRFLLFVLSGCFTLSPQRMLALAERQEGMLCFAMASIAAIAIELQDPFDDNGDPRDDPRVKQLAARVISLADNHPIVEFTFE